MSKRRPLFVVDTCIGGLSVVRTLRNTGLNDDVHFLADYAVNPLGTKNDAAIADVARQWLTRAQRHSDNLVIACNTLSIRYQALRDSGALRTDPGHVVSMVDCFAEMLRREAGRLAGKRIVILGTAFTAGQPLYAQLLRSAIKDADIESVAATELERRIARFEPCGRDFSAALDETQRALIRNADVVLLACTCFPLVRAELERAFPGVDFVDPGAYCADLLALDDTTSGRALELEVTGDVALERVREFAASYLGDCCVLS